MSDDLSRRRVSDSLKFDDNFCAWASYKTAERIYHGSCFVSHGAKTPHSAVGVARAIDYDFIRTVNVYPEERTLVTLTFVTLFFPWMLVILCLK